MTKNKSLFKNIALFLCLVPMLLLSLFVAIPNKNIKGVYALDDVSTYVEFTGSDLITFTTLKNLNSDYVWNTTANVSFKFATFGNNFSFYCDGFGYEINNIGSVVISDWNLYKKSSPSVIIPENEFNNNSLSLGSSDIYYLQTAAQAADWGVHFSAYSTAEFNADVYCVELGTRSDFVHLPALSSTYWQCFYFRYYSDMKNSQYCEFEFYCPLNIAYNVRTYYFANYFENQDGYDAGYQSGYDAGVVDGNGKGYKDGYSAGETIGYGNGFNAGLEQSNKYSFNSLIGAVIDAPVSAFTSLLNFEFLGVNILGLVTGLLSLAIIVLIIKLCMGGR